MITSNISEVRITCFFSRLTRQPTVIMLCLLFFGNLRATPNRSTMHIQYTINPCCAAEFIHGSSHAAVTRHETNHHPFQSRCALSRADRPTSGCLGWLSICGWRRRLRRCFLPSLLLPAGRHRNRASWKRGGKRALSRSHQTKLRRDG